MRAIRLLNVVLLLLTLLTGASARGSTFTELYVFGDGLSDGGNAYLRTGGLFPPPPYAVRFSNGPIAVERLAANLGIPLAPSLAGGTNYAVGGAATGQVPIPSTLSTTDNYITVGYPPLAPFFAGTGIDNQVARFAAAAPAINSGTSLFVVWGGPNDFFINPSAATATAAVSNLYGELMWLYLLGARNFLVPNMSDLSLTPSGIGLTPAEQLGLHQLSVGFNAGLQSMLDALALLPGVNIAAFDTFGFMNGILANPAAFGLTNVSDPCFSGLAVCSDPSTYLFWDGVYPTTAAHRFLADAIYESLNQQPGTAPEPGILALLGLGLAGLAATRRRKQ